MRKISEHVRAVIREQPFLAEVLREGIGNVATIARKIKKRVEERAYGRVSVPSIAMALHRLESVDKKLSWGHRYLHGLSDITVRGNLVLWYMAHRAEDDRHLYERLARIAEKHQGVFCNVIYGVRETMILAHRDLDKALTKALTDIRVFQRCEGLSAITMRLPEASLSVPGVYYPLLQAIAWEGVSVTEVISVRSEFTVVCQDEDIQKVVKVVTEASKG